MGASSESELDSLRITLLDKTWTQCSFRIEDKSISYRWEALSIIPWCLVKVTSNSILIRARSGCLLGSRRAGDKEAHRHEATMGEIE